MLKTLLLFLIALAIMFYKFLDLEYDSTVRAQPNWEELQSMSEGAMNFCNKHPEHKDCW